jgi:hypothetical protein
MRRRSVMAAGAYTVVLFAGNSTVAIPPPKGSGATKFGDVFVSFASSATVAVQVTVLTKTGSVNLGTINVGPGRTGSGHAFGPDDLALHVTYTPVGGEAISALVEYTTP